MLRPAGCSFLCFALLCGTLQAFPQVHLDVQRLDKIKKTDSTFYRMVADLFCKTATSGCRIEHNTDRTAAEAKFFMRVRRSTADNDPVFTKAVQFSELYYEESEQAEKFSLLEFLFRDEQTTTVAYDKLNKRTSHSLQTEAPMGYYPLRNGNRVLIEVEYGFEGSNGDSSYHARCRQRNEMLRSFRQVYAEAQ